MLNIGTARELKTNQLKTKIMKNRIIATETKRHFFKEIDSLDDITSAGYSFADATQIWKRESTSLTDFIKGMELEQNWLPFGYGLRFILKSKTGAITAFLFKNPKQA